MKRGLTVFILAAALGGCGAGGAPPAVADGDEHIGCALAGAQDFKPVCAVERIHQDGSLILIVRHPDGGFRRFEVVADGRGVVAADGADTVHSALIGQQLEVTVGQDRYRFPATAKANAARN